MSGEVCNVASEGAGAEEVVVVVVGPGGPSQLTTEELPVDSCAVLNFGTLYPTSSGGNSDPASFIFTYNASATALDTLSKEYLFYDDVPYTFECPLVDCPAR